MPPPNCRCSTKPAPVTIGGISGQQLDVQVVGKLPGPPSCNGDPHPCVRMGTTPDFAPTFDGGFGAAFEAGYSTRVWTFDVHGTPVAVAWTDLTPHFASNLPAAEKIIRTARFTCAASRAPFQAGGMSLPPLWRWRRWRPRAPDPTRRPPSRPPSRGPGARQCSPSWSCG